MAKQACPVCGTEVEQLLTIDPGMKLRLKEAGQSELPSAACSNCYSNFTSTISQGAQLRAKEQARAQHRMSMWRNRVSLIKQARQHMEGKAYSEAAVFYEKYLKILEVIYELSPGGLTPEIFKNKARQKELTVITTVYWDLVRIYDSSEKYGDRLQKSIAKLILFAPYSTIKTALYKNAANYIKTSKHPQLFAEMEKKLGIKKKGCFVATAAFENDQAPEVLLLRRFRDQYLIRTKFGNYFVEKYYNFSPPVARWMQNNPKSKKPVRTMLRVITFCLEKIL